MVGRNWERVQVHLMARRLDLACRVTRCMTGCMENSRPSPVSMLNDGDGKWTAGIGCLLWNYLNQNVIIRNGTKEKDRRLFDMSRFRFRAYARGLGHVHLVIRRNWETRLVSDRSRFGRDADCLEGSELDLGWRSGVCGWELEFVPVIKVTRV